MPKEIKEALDMAKERNSETLRIMTENAFNVDKVLELKKEFTKTETYIKTLEKALAFKRKEQKESGQGSEYGKTEKTDFEKAHEWLIVKKQDRRWLTLLFSIGTGLVFSLAVAGTKLGSNELPPLVLGTSLFLAMQLCFMVIQHFESSDYEEDLEYLIYLSSKDWVKAIQDNDMKIPFPFTKASYTDSLKIIEEYEAKHPEKAIRD